MTWRAPPAGPYTGELVEGAGASGGQRVADGRDTPIVLLPAKSALDRTSFLDFLS